MSILSQCKCELYCLQTDTDGKSGERTVNEPMVKVGDGK